MFKSLFLDEFFYLELREAKVQEFINLCQGCISVKEYALNFINNQNMVVDSRTNMSRFMSDVSDLVEKEGHTEMLFHDMDMSSLMVYSQQIEESKIKEKNREVKRDKTGDGNISNA